MLVKPVEKKEKTKVISVFQRGGKPGSSGSAQKDENCTMPSSGK